MMGKLGGMLIKGGLWILSIILCISINYTVVLALNNVGNINYKSISVDDGLSQSQVSVIYQDSLGYIWIGTNDGLNKYNGHEFKVFRNKENDTKSISGNSITAIREDEDKNLWVGTKTGLNKINLNDGKITRYDIDENDYYKSNYDITDIFINKNGDILVGTKDGINIYDKENDNFIRVYQSNEEEYALSCQKINSIEEDENGYYWIGTDDGLNRIDKKTNKIKKYFADENDKNSISINYINTVYADNKNNLWIGTNYGGLNKLNLETEEIERFVPTSEQDTISGFSIRDIIEDNKGRLWIATEQGICEFDVNINKFRRHKHKPFDKKSLISDCVFSLFEDKSGLIWIGTYRGVNTFYPENTFRIYSYDVTDVNSLSDNIISGIYEDEEGLLWVGTCTEGLNIIDRESNNIKRIQHKKNKELEITNNLIREITGIDDEIWIATQNGLHKYDKTTDSMSYYFEKDGLVNNDIRTIFIDSKGILWIGTREGLCTFDREGEFTDYTGDLKASGITEMKINHISEDEDGEIWIASEKEGLFRLDKEANTLKSYNNFSENSNQYDNTISVTPDVMGIIWIATDNGLIKFNKESEEYFRYTIENGLSSNFVYGILFDENKNLWMSTNYGISTFDPINETFINYYDTDGIQGNEFNQYAYYKSKNGEMFFGGIEGLTSFYSKDISNKLLKPEIIVESVFNSGNELNINERIELDYKNANIFFEFFIQDYRKVNKLQYSYKLVGVDNEWSNAKNINYVNYANLKSGNYTFLVAGSNSFGVWSEVASIKFKVNKPPGKTPTAYLAYFIVISGIGYLIWDRVNILNAIIKQRTIELNNKLVENEELYTKLLENEKNKNNYFVNLSHELRTPLNIIVSIQSVMRELNKNEQHIPKEKINYYVDLLKINSNRLLNLINNIINTSKIECGQYKLDIDNVEIVSLVEDTVLSTKELIYGKGISLIIDPNIEEKFIQCDKFEIEKCILNLISNAIKFTESGGTIEVGIEDLDEKVKISIKDTGCGIDIEYQELIFNRFNQSYKNSIEQYGGNGLGLTFTRQLVELHGGYIYVESVLGEGSKFNIVLPVKSVNKNAEKSNQ